MSKFAIAIATVNRADLLVPTLNRYVLDFPDIDIHVYDNGNQELPTSYNGGKVHIHTGENIGVAGAWNFLLKQIYKKHKYALVINDDVYLGLKQTDVDKVIDEHKNEGFITTMYDWSVFLLPVATYTQVGTFDEQFYPAYCEDSDYEYRMKLMGVRQLRTPKLFPALYRVSMTTHKEPEKYRQLFAKNKVLYRKKWGGNPNEETYKKPYNK